MDVTKQNVEKYWFATYISPQQNLSKFEQKCLRENGIYLVPVYMPFSIYY